MTGSNDRAASSLGVRLVMDGYVQGEISDVDVPGVSVDVKQYKNQNNQGGIVGKIPTWINVENLKFKMRYTGKIAQYQMLTDVYARTKRIWYVVPPADFTPVDTSAPLGYYFTGFVSKYSPGMKGEDVIDADIEVSVDGKLYPLTTRSAGLTTPFFTCIDDDTHTLVLTPAASATIYEYSALAYHSGTPGVNTNTVIITPTATAGTIYVNGVVVGTGVASGTIPVGQNTGDVTTITIVVEQANKIPVIYDLTILTGSAGYS